MGSTPICQSVKYYILADRKTLYLHYFELDGYMSEKTLYEKHKKNHDDITVSFDNLLQNLLQSIKKSDKPHIKTNTRLLIFLLGTYAETFLNSFLYELHYQTQNPYFTENEIRNILNIKEQEKRWHYIIKLSMEKKLKKNYDELERVERLVYDDILHTFIEHIVPIIRLRNKIAHGNWTYIINGADEIVSNEVTIIEALHKENYLSIKHKKMLLIKLKELLIALISGNETIYEAYNKAYPNIQNISREINDIGFKKFSEWEKQQQLTYQKAQEYKNKNMQNNNR